MFFYTLYTFIPPLSSYYPLFSYYWLIFHTWQWGCCNNEIWMKQCSEELIIALNSLKVAVTPSGILLVCLFPSWTNVYLYYRIIFFKLALCERVLQHVPAVFISHVNDCPACHDTVMLSDRLIYLPVSLPQVLPPPSFLSLSPSRLSGRVWFSFFFNLNLNSPSDSVARQNKLFKSFNEEVQSTGTSVQTHLEQQWLTSYRCTARCVQLCLCLGWKCMWQDSFCVDTTSGSRPILIPVLWEWSWPQGIFAVSSGSFL